MQRMKPIIVRCSQQRIRSLSSNASANIGKLTPLLQSILSDNALASSLGVYVSQLPSVLTSRSFSTDPQRSLRNNIEDDVRNEESDTEKYEKSANGGGSSRSKSLKLNLISTTHSRHHVAPIAPFDELQTLTNEILSSNIGSLFSFHEDDLKSYDHPHDVSDEISQKVEFILRGHSALIPNSLLDRENAMKYSKYHPHQKYRKDIPDEDLEPERYQEWLEARSGNVMTVKERLFIVMRLVQRMEQEGELYQQQAEDYRLSLLAPTTITEFDNDSDSYLNLDDLTTKMDNKDETNQSFAPKQKPASVTKTVHEKYSAPGPTTHMYDLLLDAYALCAAHEAESLSSTKTTTQSISAPNVSDTLSMIEQAQNLHQKAIVRHILDGDHLNINPKTIPTQITYNALIRTVSLSPYLSTTQNTTSHIPNLDIPTSKLRDTALNIALNTMREMEVSVCIERNSMTWVYVLQTIQKYIPESRSRGNIVRALFHIAGDTDGVVNQQVLDALASNGGGEEYKSWIETRIQGKKYKDLNRKWFRLVNKTRCKTGNGFY